MKTFKVSTYKRECNVPGYAVSVTEMLRGQGAFAYGKSQAAEAAAAVALVESLRPGDSCQVQRSWHPRHGADMATVVRLA